MTRPWTPIQDLADLEPLHHSRSSPSLCLLCCSLRELLAACPHSLSEPRGAGVQAAAPWPVDGVSEEEKLLRFCL